MSEDTRNTIIGIVIFFTTFSMCGGFYKVIDNHNSSVKNESQLKDDEALPKYAQVCDDEKGILSFIVKSTLTGKTAIVTCNNGTVKEMPFR